MAQLPYVFTRTNVDFGTDVAPTNAAYLNNDNVIEIPLFGPGAEPSGSLAFAYHGPAASPNCDVDVYLWDDAQQLWFRFFSRPSVEPEEVVFLPKPTTFATSQDRPLPAMHVAVVATPIAAHPVGDYVFALAPATDATDDIAIQALLAAIGATLTGIYNDTTSIDGKLPAPVLYDMDGTASDVGGNGDYDDYIDMRLADRWSAHFVPTGDGTQTLTIWTTDDDAANGGAVVNWVDVTLDWTGFANFTAEEWIEKETPTTCTWVRLRNTVAGLAVPADQADWVLRAKSRNGIA